MAIPHYYNANIGFYDRNSKLPWSVQKPISKIIIYPEYSNLRNDIALLKLEVDLKFYNFVFWSKILSK